MSVWLALLMACDVGDLRMARAAPPVRPPSIERPPEWVVGGRPVGLRVQGVGGGDVAVVGSFSLDETTCPGVVAPACVPLGEPLRVLGTLVNPSLAVYTQTVRVRAPAVDETQTMGLVAVVRAGDGSVSVSARTELLVLADGADEDNDGVSNGDEVRHRLNPLRADTDGDALSDGEEVALGSDPRRWDTDRDELSDGAEVARGLDPTHEDSDRDGLSDYEEGNRYSRYPISRLNPLDPDYDNDGHLDGEEIDAGTDPLDPYSPWPGPSDDTSAGLDSGVERCADGEIIGCWGACVPDTRHDGVCDRWLDCPRYTEDHLDCEGQEPPRVCAAGTILGCWGACEPEAQIGDGVCDDALSCPMRAWDGGDCTIGEGPTLSAYVEVDDAGDLQALAGVQHLDGELRIRRGAPPIISLPDLISVRALVVEPDAEVQSLLLPNLVVVDGELRIEAGERVDLPLDVALGGLDRVGRALVLSGARLRSVDLGGLQRVGQQLTLSGLSSMSALPLPRLRAALGGVVMDGAHGYQRLDLPVAEDLGDAVVLEVVGLRVFSAPLATRVRERIYVGPSSRLVELDLPRVADSPDLVLRGRLLSRVDLSAIPYADSVFADEMPGALLLGAMEASRNITITGASAVALDALASVDLLTVHIAGALDTPSLRAAGRVDVTAGSWSADHLERASRLRLQLGAGGGAFGALTSAEIEEIGTAGLVTMPSMSSVRILRVRTSGGGCLRMDGLEQAFLYPGRPLLDGSYMAGNVSVVSDGSGRVAFEAPRLVEVDGLVLADATVALDALERASVVSVLRSPSAQTEVRLPALVEVGALDVESWTWNWRTSYLGFPSRDTGGREPLQVRVPNLERATRVSIHGIEEVVLLDLSGLTDVGELDLEDVGGAMTLRLDSLLRAGRSRAAGPFGAPHLIVSENDGRRHDGVDLNRVGGLSALDLPALETISSVRVTASPALQAMRAPRLADAGDLLFTELTDTQWGVLLAPAIPTPPSTTHFDLHLPRLASVNDLFIVHDRRFNLLDLPSLTDVSFRLRARDAPNLGAVNAPVLASSDAWIELTGASALTSVSLPALHRLGRLALNGTALTALDLPALTWLGDALSAWANPSLGALRLTGLTHAGELYLDDNDGLTVIGMPALAEVGPAWVGGHGVLGEVSLPSLELISGRLDVVDNAALTTLALPALRSVAEVHVVGNPALDACAVEADVSGASLGGVEVEPSCALAP